MVQPGRPPPTTGPATTGPVTSRPVTSSPVTSTPAAGGPGSSGDGDWAVQAADTIESLVGKVRDKTAAPLVTVARAVVFGLLAAAMGLVVAVLAVVMLVRVIDVITGDGNVWIAYLIVGGLFAGVGAFLLRKATTTPTTR